VLEIQKAQYRPGPFPTGDGGPAALALATRHANVLLERVGERATATLEPAARAAVYGIDGYDGAWIVTAGPPDLSAPAFPTANVSFGVRAALPPGPFVLKVAAADRDGRFGAPATAELIANAVDPPAGTLVIHLEWDSAADLDLHVVDAEGGEAWSDKPNSMPTPEPGTVVDPTEYLKHGILDHDGNKACRHDGRPNENVIWTVPPPAGEYVVRVDARAMCGAPGTSWTVTVLRDGDVLGAAQGFAAPDDTLGQPGQDPIAVHGAGAGLFALRFSL
jgi:hypothetical protein